MPAGFRWRNMRTSNGNLARKRSLSLNHLADCIANHFAAAGSAHGPCFLLYQHSTLDAAFFDGPSLCGSGRNGWLLAAGPAGDILHPPVARRCGTRRDWRIDPNRGQCG